MRLTTHLQNTSNQQGAEKLAALLDGTTYMNLKILACPYGGGFEILAEGEAENEVELADMVMSVLAHELMTRL